MTWSMKAIATACLLGVLFLTKHVASKPHPGSSAHFPFAYAQYGCAPTDALALGFISPPSTASAARSANPTSRFLSGKTFPSQLPTRSKCAAARDPAFVA